MKIVDETEKKTVRFGQLKVGHAFEYHNVVWRKIGQAVASPISKHRDETEYFVVNDIVIPVDYEITVKSPAKKKVPFTDVPVGGVFRYDGDLCVKVGSLTGRRVSDFNRVVYIPEEYLVEHVDATLTIRDTE